MNYLNVAKIKAFDYPGRTLMFHTALVYNPENRLDGFADVIRELEDEFDLRRL